MLGRLFFSPREYLLTRWEDEKWRKPFLFSAGIHLAILLIALMPSNLFFSHRTMPVVYSVDLFDLDELPTPAPEDFQEAAPQEKETMAPAAQTRSLQPVLSTRTIPKAPSEIRLLRPRTLKNKKDVRLPPMDPNMVLAALNRIQQQEKAIEAKEKAFAAIRKSIMARETATSQDPQDEDWDSGQEISSTPGTQKNVGYGGPPGGGQAANTATKKFVALTKQHIIKSWILPEGQIWHKDLYATVLVKVRPDGIVTSAELEERSENDQFDKFVMQTIEQASPLPPVPEEIANHPLRLHFYPEGMR